MQQQENSASDNLQQQNQATQSQQNSPIQSQHNSPIQSQQNSPVQSRHNSPVRQTFPLNQPQAVQNLGHNVMQQPQEYRLQQLQRERNNLYAQIQRLENAIHSTPRPSLSALKIQTDRVASVLDKFEVIQSQIESMRTQEDSGKIRETFETWYYETLGEAQDVIKANEKKVDAETFERREFGFIQQDVADVKLPPLQLPKFTGDFRKWLSFKDAFEANIGSRRMSDTKKFQYLRGQLEGPAAQIIENLDTGSQSYAIAWKLLQDTYEDKKLLIDIHLKALFEIKPIQKVTAVNLREFIDTLNAHIRSLEKLESKIDGWGNMILTHLIQTKLDFSTKRDWEKNQEISSTDELPTVDQLISFLSRRCKTLLREDSEKSQSAKSSSVKSKTEKTSMQKKVSMATTNAECVLCKASHKIYFCPDFLNLSVEMKQEKAQELQLCKNCLGHGHFAKNCKSSKCKKCSKSHNTLLHKDNDNQSTEDNQNQLLTNHGLNAQQQNTYVLLATAIILVKDKHGKFKEARALLDPGSQASYVSQELVNRLQLPSKKTREIIAGITSSTFEVTRETTIHFKSRTSEYAGTIQGLHLPKITQKLPNFNLNIEKFEIPANIQLADPTFYRSSDIDLLIGAEIVWSLLSNEQLKVNRNLPLFQNTKIGWIVSGPISTIRKQPTKQTCHAISLEKQVQRFWQQEEVETSKDFTEQEQICEDHFLNTYKRGEDGRFIVRLPINDNLQLGNSSDIALARLHQLERRFSNNPEMKSSYQEFMDEYIQLDHMKEVTEDHQADEKVYYMPHQPVIRKDALTTKLRVVFDASAATTSGNSLNDLLLIGPTIQQDVMTILIRFRIHQFVMNADIEKMYRQIEVAKEDQPLQRIFWRKNDTESVKNYQLTTVTYGTASAPFLATRCLKELAMTDGSMYPLARRALLHDFYMDDLLTGSHTKEDALQLRKQLNTLLEGGKFRLRKWRFNTKEIQLATEDSGASDSLHILQNVGPLKTLGLLWNNDTDTFEFNPINMNPNQAITKRFILSTIARLFDPLGLLAPFLIRAKLLLKQLWENELEWDEEVPDDVLSSWKKWSKTLEEMRQIQIPRNINPGNISTKIAIHAFCDASPKAFGASIYAVSTNSEGNKISRLICAKSRVAPKQPVVTLPRLELNGAVLLTKLVKKVKEALDGRIDEITAWTDSKIVLAWINTNPSNLQVYVANRVKEIISQPEIDWKHIPTDQNPADLLTRDSYKHQLIDNDMWWSGPEMLVQDEWPEQSQEFEFSNDELELKKKFTCVTVNDDTESLLIKYSSFKKLRRVVSTCLRWKLKHQKKVSGPLTCEELQKAEQVIIKLIQAECFPEELKQLRQNQPVTQKSKLYPLHPYLDQTQLIRITGRLSNADMTEERKHPIALPNHFVTELLVKKKHEEIGHCGTEQLLSEIRQKYWPVFGRKLIKKVIKSCHQCYKIKPKPCQYQMGQLPKDRVNKMTRPFESTGLDYAGPITLKEKSGRGRCKLYKSWIALFICMATKAVHIEIVTDLTTEAFMACLTRFTSRRGLCKTLNSDNATTFVGANNVLQEIHGFLSQNNNFIEQELAEKGITWKFIPPRAPHFGGLWESNIKSMKKHLLKITQGITMTFEECITLTASIEACLNSRPLVPLSNDPTDLSVLTPAHFLIGDSLFAPLEQDYTEIPSNRLSRWQHLHQMRQHYWQRWQREYLHQLQTQAKWHKANPNIKVGDMVLMIDDNLPPLKWNLGRVLQLYPGNDGVVRVVQVKTRAGVLKRAVTSLSLLPASNNQTETQ